jgi:ABC-type antimicrobial peptide transport system permease subunit
MPSFMTWRDLLHHWRSSLAMIAVTVLAVAVLTGALLTGASVRESLRQLSAKRLGSIVHAVSAQNSFFSADLADTVAAETGYTAAPVIQLRGTVSAMVNGISVNNVMVYGIDGRFTALGQSSRDSQAVARAATIGDGTVPVIACYLNAAAAARLAVQPDDELLIRLPKPGAMPLEAPLAQAVAQTVIMRASVAGTLGYEELGWFALEAHQIPAPAIFVPLDQLAALLGIPGKANLILSAAADAGAILGAIRNAFTLDDAGLLVSRPDSHQSGTAISAHIAHVLSRRVFIDPALAALLLGISADKPERALPGSVSYREGLMGSALEPVVTGPVAAEQSALRRISAEPMLSYFVNRITAGDRMTPYSFIGTAPAGSFGAAGHLAAGELVLSDWLAADLGITAIGGDVELAYFVPDDWGSLREERWTLRVADIRPLGDQIFASQPAPDFPGIAGAASCADWSPGIPIDLGIIRQQDEHFWQAHRTTPKAVVSYSDAVGMWGNRFGTVSAIRYSAGSSELLDDHLSGIEEGLKALLPGVTLRDLVNESGMALGGAVDFGGLFLGMSFFLILGAVLLASLVNALHLDSRRPQIALLMALGFPGKSVRRLLITGSGLLAVIGGLLGLPAGIAFAHLLLTGLSTIWRGALGTTELSIDLPVGRIVLGMVGGTLVALLGTVLPLWRAALHCPEGLRGSVHSALAGSASARLAPFSRLPAWLPGLCFAAATAMLVLGAVHGPAVVPYLFFPAGFLMLVAWALLFGRLLFPGERGRQAQAGQTGGRLLTRSAMILSGIRRNGRQNLLAALLLALGVFIVAAVGANRRDVYTGSHAPAAGTGGFDYYIHTTVPLPRDIDSIDGRYRYGLEAYGREALSFVGLRLAEGADAGCLNVYQAGQPGLLGVDPAAFASRQAFTFLSPEFMRSNGWERWSLIQNEPRVIPGIVDHAVLLWGLGMSLGDRIDYRDEFGQPFAVELVASLADSIFQGSILIREADFIHYYPSSGGYNVLLVDAPDSPVAGTRAVHAAVAGSVAGTVPGAGTRAVPAAVLVNAFRNHGPELSTTTERLALFLEVENTYLSIFFVLGALGLLLGSLGMGIVVMKNLVERRCETALLRALGYPAGKVRRLLYAEYFTVTLAGGAAGTLSALIAAAPALIGRTAPVGSIASAIGAILLVTSLVLMLAVRCAFDGDFMQALRHE